MKSSLMPQGQTARPMHVAIIMDGNGRWATGRGLKRLEGHRRGVESVRGVVRAAGELGIKYLTLYSFSIENWNRPKSEVNGLMQLFRRFVKRNLKELHQNNVKVTMIGRREGVEEDILRWIDKAVDTTKDNTGLRLTLAFNYGGQQEIMDAAKSILKSVDDGVIKPEDIDEALVDSRLYTSDLPNPDLMIRTSGEQRISNYLLWQSADAEYYDTEVLWPDFEKQDLEKAIAEYSRRLESQAQATPE